VNTAESRTSNMSTRLKHSVLAVFVAAALGSAVTLVVGCGGSGGGGTIAGLPGPQTTHTPAPTATPTPVPTPSPTPQSCTALSSSRAARTQLAMLRRAVIPSRIGPGPSRQVCPYAMAGRARCMAWVRTDVTRPLQVGPAGYSPADLQAAYNLTSASSTDGVTQTVAIIDAYDDPDAESDLGTYRATFALTPCTSASGCFLKLNESGSTSPLPSTDPTGGWEGEESLDIEMVSAICPNCKILLLEANSNSTSDLYTAENSAVTCGANVVSNSWEADEYSGETFDEVNFNHPGVMITVASGDDGYDGSGTGYPASSQYVTAVGGTTLINSSGSWSESVWPGTGSRCSLYIAQPSWQTALGTNYTNVCSNRIDNDVAAIADPNYGVAVYDSFGGSGPASCGGWCVYGGTSVASPIIGSVYALAGNGASLTDGSYSYSHLGALTDIVSGSNGTCGNYLCTAEPGYDGPTGNGTPNGIGAF
jgi:hypothetical protein